MASSFPIRTRGTRRNVRRRRRNVRRAIAQSAWRSWRRWRVAAAELGGVNPFGSGEVGQTYNGALLLPTNQWISPIGTRIEDP